MEELCNFFAFAIFFRNFGMHLLRLMNSSFPFPKFSPRCSLRNRQVRNRYCSYECHETWADYEIHHPRGHGWYYRYLWIGRCCPHCRCSRRTQQIFIVQVSSIFWWFFTISFWVMWPKKKINDHNPLHSHLLIQPIYTTKFKYKWSSCDVFVAKLRFWA